MRINQVKIIVILTVIFCLNVFDNVLAIEIDGRLTTEINYAHIDDKTLPEKVVADLESDAKSVLNLDFFGVYKDYQYDIRLEGDSEENSLEINQATISTMIGATILELGKRDWVWGKGFSYYPTYPLNNDEEYLGGELSWMSGVSTYKLGTAFDKDDKKLYSGWIKVNTLLETSDYDIILSYQKDDSEEKKIYNSLQNSNKANKEDGVNIGLNYSKDFLNGLTFRSEYNLGYWRSDKSKESKYLVGGDYIMANNKMITMEYYREEDDYLVLVMGNQSDSFNNWSWEAVEVINLKDRGERRSFELAYSKEDSPKYSVEVINFAGNKDSKIERNPKDWTIDFEIEVDLF